MILLLIYVSVQNLSDDVSAIPLKHRLFLYLDAEYEFCSRSERQASKSALQFLCFNAGAHQMFGSFLCYFLFIVTILKVCQPLEVSCHCK